MGRQNPKVITIESKRLLSRSESGKTHLARVNYCLDGVSQSFDNNRKVTAVWFLTPTCFRVHCKLDSELHMLNPIEGDLEALREVGKPQIPPPFSGLRKKFLRVLTGE